MDMTDQNPPLGYFVRWPEDLSQRPPLLSSLQGVETSFMLIALRRYPHALTTCASAIESAMKAALEKGPKDRISATKLYEEALEESTLSRRFPSQDLDGFRKKRNTIVHYGFSPDDDEISCDLLLKTGFPFLAACYDDLLGFNIWNGLHGDVRLHLGVALEAYAAEHHKTGFRAELAFAAFGHLLRWHFSIASNTQSQEDVLEEANSIGLQFEADANMKSRLEEAFNHSWELDCPVCDSVYTLVCDLDLDPAGVTALEAACAHCGLHLPTGPPALAPRLCHDQLAAENDQILREYGVRS